MRASIYVYIYIPIYAYIMMAVLQHMTLGPETLAASGDDLHWDGNKLATSIDLNSKQNAL